MTYIGLSFQPSPRSSPGLLKMGDHYSSEGDMVEAISLYSRAALHGSPQVTHTLTSSFHT